MAKESNALSVLMSPNKVNVLVVGNSGVGKSTLINAVLGSNYTVTSHQPKGVTNTLEIYENAYLPLRLIDTIGFEDSKKQTKNASKEIDKWLKDSARKKDIDKLVNEIWVCIDGTACRLFEESIKKIDKATRLWKSVPIIFVITKSYSNIEREDNIDMVYQALKAYKNQDFTKRVKKVIPVIAKGYPISEEVFVEPDGIEELVQETMALMPIGKLRAKEDLARFNAFANMKKAEAVVAYNAFKAAVSGILPSLTNDKLRQIQADELLKIASIYGMAETNQNVQYLLRFVVDKGFLIQAELAAHKILQSKLAKNIAVKKAMNSIITAGFVIALGQAEIYIFDQVTKGKKKFDDLSWATTLLEKQINSEFIERVEKALKKLSKEYSKNKKLKLSQIVAILMEGFFGAEDNMEGRKK